MPYTHAVVWTDHHQAEVTRFNAEQSETQKLHAHNHPTGQHHSGVRAEHEFLGKLCTAIEAMPLALVMGSHTVLTDMKHYVEKHRPQVARHIAAYEVAAHLTEGQRVAQARKFFIDRERLAPQA